MRQDVSARRTAAGRLSPESLGDTAETETDYRRTMNDYVCFGCNANIIDGQHVVLKTTVLSVQWQWLGESTIYHERCYPPAAPTTDEEKER